MRGHDPSLDLGSIFCVNKDIDADAFKAWEEPIRGKPNSSRFADVTLLFGWPRICTSRR